jgi:hypothetical protein
MDAREHHPNSSEPDDREIDAATGSNEGTAESASAEESNAAPGSGESASDWRSRLWKSSRTAWNWD